MSDPCTARFQWPAPEGSFLNRVTVSEAGGLTNNPVPEMRASDAEREAVAVALRQNAADGRLMMEELEERLGSTFAPKTCGDLQPLFADLAKFPDAGAPTWTARFPADWRGIRPARWGPRSGLLLMVLCWAMWGFSVTTSAGHSLEGLWPRGS
jgi:Domain of unknown function (DUF1707)